MLSFCVTVLLILFELTFKLVLPLIVLVAKVCLFSHLLLFNVCLLMETYISFTILTHTHNNR